MARVISWGETVGNFRCSIIVALAFFAASIARGAPPVRGDYLPQDEVPWSTCELTADNPSANYQHVCSASYLGDSWFITAAHCLPDQGAGWTWHVRCANGGFAPIVEKRIYPLASDSGDAWTYDLALVRASIPMKLDPMRIPTGEAEEEALLAGGKCVLAGYGANNSGGIGYLYGVRAPRTFMSGHYLASMGRNHIDGGDSGGSLACRDMSGAWVLLGVHSSLVNGTASFSTRVLSAAGWLSARSWADSYDPSSELQAALAANSDLVAATRACLASLSEGDDLIGRLLAESEYAVRIASFSNLDWTTGDHVRAQEIARGLNGADYASLWCELKKAHR